MHESFALDRKLRRLACGDTVTVWYYADGGYREISGRGQKIMPALGKLVIGETVIRVEDVVDVL